MLSKAKQLISSDIHSSTTIMYYYTIWFTTK